MLDDLDGLEPRVEATIRELAARGKAGKTIVNNGLRLEPAWTKSREPGFPPLPARFVKQLAPHKTPGLTANTYTRTRNERLAAIAEKLGETVLLGANRVHSEVIEVAP